VVSCTDGSTASYLIGGYIDSSGNVNWGSWTTLSNANGISANSYNGRLFHHSGTTWTYFYSNSSGNYKGRVITKNNNSTGLTVNGETHLHGGNSSYNYPVTNSTIIKDNNNRYVFCVQTSLYGNHQMSSCQVSGTSFSVGTNYNFGYTPGGWKGSIVFDPSTNRFVCYHLPNTSNTTAICGYANSNGTLTYSSTAGLTYIGPQGAGPRNVAMNGYVTETSGKLFSVNASNNSVSYSGYSAWWPVFNASYAMQAMDGNVIYKGESVGASPNQQFQLEKDTFSSSGVPSSSNPPTVEETPIFYLSDFDLYTATPSWSHWGTVTPDGAYATCWPTTSPIANRVVVLKYAAGPNVNKSFLGIANGTYSANSTAEVVVGGGVAAGLSGLTAGQFYSIREFDGTFQPTNTTDGQMLALSSSTGLIK